MRKHLSSSLLVCGLLANGCGDSDEAVQTPELGERGAEIAETSAALRGGTATNVRPEIGYLGNCTATLVDPRYIITAAHCFGYATAPQSGTFTMTSTTGTLLPSVTVTRSYSAGSALGDFDIALARLQTAVPAATATPAQIALLLPTNGTQVTAFGYGCNVLPPANDGIKRYLTYTYPTSDANCEGDSGGPRVFGGVNDNGQIWGINSGRHPETNAIANTTGRHVLRAVRSFGDSEEQNRPLAVFAGQAGTANVRAVAGDFNADGRVDVALFGGAGWNTIPVAFGNSTGFTYTNLPVPSHPNFPALAAMARSIVTGDFDADGDADVALLGGAGWNTIPIGLSNRDGTFTVLNQQSAFFAGLATHPGAFAVAGDFDADGDADIALAGGLTWNTVPVAFSLRNGSFTVTNSGVSQFPDWSREPGVKAFVGDFDVDGDADIALTGVASWNTIPIALSSRTGAFTTSNRPAPEFAALSHLPSVKVVAGDFDGDGDPDLAALGGSDWRTVAFALSVPSTASFEFANFPMQNFPGWGNAARLALAGRLDAGSTSDLILTGNSGWNTVPVALLRP